MNWTCLPTKLAMHEDDTFSQTSTLGAAEPPLSADDAALLLARVHESGMDALQTGEPRKLLQDLLWVVSTITRAGFGTVHLLDEESQRLELAIYGGRLHTLAEMFQTKGDGTSVVASAWQSERGVVVDDVRATNLYSSPAREALLRGRALSVASTPLIAAGGERVGLLTVFFEQTGRATASRTPIVDAVMRCASDYVRQARRQSRLRASLAADREARHLAEVANHRRDDFLAIMSHELRQPLSAALPALEVQRHTTDEEHRRRALEIIEQQLRQLVGLVEDMADLARINRGTLSLRRQRVDLRTIVRQAVDMARPALERKRQDVAVSLGFEPAWAIVDPMRMKQVFSNLLHNAATYTPQGGQVRIELTMDTDFVVVRVADSGVGILPADLERIFSLYARGSKTLLASGFGIGLSVVQQVIEMHGGTVSAVSDGKGHGSEFVVRVPLPDAQTTEADSKRTPSLA